MRILLDPAVADPPAGAPPAAHPPGNPVPGAMSAWMNTIQTELPNPSLGGADNAPADNGKTGAEPKPADGAAPKGDTGKSPVGDAATAPAKGADDLPDDKWPRTAQEWKKFKEARKVEREERETKIKALEKELTDTKSKIVATPTDSPEWKALTKEKEELSEALRRLEVTQHPRFVSYFKNKVDAQVSLAKNIVGNDMAERAEKLLALPDGEYKTNQLEEFMLELSPMQQTRFGAVLNSMADIDAERAREISKAKESYEMLQKQKADAAATTQKGLEKLFFDILGKAQDPEKGMAAFQTRKADQEGADEWNKGVEERVNKVKQMCVKCEPADAIQTVLNAVAYPHVMAENKRLTDELTKAQEQVKRLSAAQPRLEGERNGVPGGDVAQRVEIKKGATPMEVTQGFVQGLRLARDGQ